MRLMIATFAVLTPLQTARADALDDAIARELCGSTPSNRNLPNCGADELTSLAVAVGRDLSADLAQAKAKPLLDNVVLGPDLEDTLRWHATLGFQLGSMRADGAALDYVAGVTAAAALQLDRIVLRGEYTISAVEFHGSSADSRGGLPPYDDTDGVMQRVGLVARYAFAKAASAPELDATRVIGELWLEAGAGEERIAWDRGGVLERPDLVIGIGTTGAVRSGAHRNGLSAAFRVYVARRTDLDSIPTCSAPCTEATPPVAWSDRSYMFDVDYTIGD
jgi:hypothetical protein